MSYIYTTIYCTVEVAICPEKLKWYDNWHKISTVAILQGHCQQHISLPSIPSSQDLQVDEVDGTCLGHSSCFILLAQALTLPSTSNQHLASFRTDTPAP